MTMTTIEQKLSMQVTLVNAKEDDHTMTLQLPCANLENILVDYFGQDYFVFVGNAECELWHDLAENWIEAELNGNFIEMNECLIIINEKLKADPKNWVLLGSWIDEETDANLDDVLSYLKDESLIAYIADGYYELAEEIVKENTSDYEFISEYVRMDDLASDLKDGACYQRVAIGDVKGYIAC